MAYEIEGLGEIIARIDNIKKTPEMSQALGKACALVERAAKEKAPKGNGELRRSIASRVEGLTGEVFSALEYAPYVEYGTGLGAYEENGSGKGRLNVPWKYRDEKGDWHTTSGMPPRPYMRPALNENIEQIKRIIKGALL